MTPRTRSVVHAFIALLAAWFAAGTAFAQTTAFSYQGKLTESGNPASGNYDMQFKLFDTVSLGTGAQQGATLPVAGVVASGGVFTVNLDFGAAALGGADRYLEIGVRPAGSGSGYTLLSPRQLLTSSPYAVQTLNASQLGGLPAGRYVAADANGDITIGTPIVNRVGKVHVAGTSPRALTVECTTPQCTTSMLALNSQGGDAIYALITGGAPGVAVTGESENAGVLGKSNAGTGVRGASTSGVGVFGTSGGFEGVRGESSHPLHSGVTGWQNSTTGGFGVFGYSQAGAGVQGNAASGNGVVGGSTTGSGVYGESAGVGLTMAGVYGKNTGSGGIAVTGEANSGSATGVFGATSSAAGFGVYGRNSGGGAALYAEGHARQSRTGGGMLKAMVEVNAAGTIVRCWNGVLGLYSGFCGMSVSTFTNVSGFFYRVDFGFQVTDRFIQLTAASGVPPTGCIVPQVAVTERFDNVVGYGAACGNAAPNPVTVFVY